MGEKDIIFLERLSNDFIRSYKNESLDSEIIDFYGNFQKRDSKRDDILEDIRIKVKDCKQLNGDLTNKINEIKNMVDADKKILSEKKTVVNDEDLEIEKINEKLHSIKAEKNTIKSKLVEKSSALKNYKRDDNSDNPLSTQYELFLKIAPIRWTSESEKVSGYIFTAENTVEPFELNNKKNSEFFISNFLWKKLQNLDTDITKSLKSLKL